MINLSEYPKLCAVLADAVLVLHFAWVLFIMAGLLLIWLGYFLKWPWVRSLCFRSTHLLAMGYVAFEAVTGRACPLTVWEDHLRYWAGGGYRYTGSFFQHWLHRLLFYEASETTFTALYVAFFGLVCLSLWLVPPRRRARVHSAPKT